MRIIIDPDETYLFRPGNIRDFGDTLEEVLAADDGYLGSIHRQRLGLMMDLLHALKRAAKEAAR